MKPCRNGHTEGRYETGVCIACSRNQGIKHREKKKARLKAERGRRAEARLPIAPLAEFIRFRALEYTDAIAAGMSKGHKELARRVAPRLGMSEGDADRTLERFLNGKMKYVRWTTADAWCCALDIHISGIYSEAELRGEWEWVEPEPVVRPKCECGRTILSKGWDQCHVCRDAGMAAHCVHCGKGLPSEHSLFLHSWAMHKDNTQGKHHWHGKKRGKVPA
jgi:DNA-binding Xre family transcriptional regulator